MNLENKFRKFLVDDNTLLSNMVLTTNSDEFDYIKSVDEKISFLKKDKITDESKKDPFSAKGRVQVNPGKFVNQLLKDTGVIGDTVSTADIEQWVNRYKSYFSDNEELKIVSGDDIKWHYNSSNYTDKRGGSLWSCMSGRECQDRLDIYVKNPDTVQLVVQYDDKKKVKSRALLWTLMDGKKMMDRIYYAEDKSINTYKRMCKDNDWLVRDNGNTGVVKCVLKNWAHDKYPYLDTMRLMDKDDETGQYFITNGNIDRNRDFIVPNGTAGYTINNQVRIGDKWYPSKEAGYCGVSGKGMLIKDLTEVPRYGKISNKLVEVDKWNKPFYKEDLVESKIMKGKLSKQAAYQLKESGDWIGRKKYRKYVENGKLADGSAVYKNKTIWVLNENVSKKADLETRIKTDIASKLKEKNRPVKEDDLEKMSITKLKELYSHTTSKKYKSDDLVEWEKWVLYEVEDEKSSKSKTYERMDSGIRDIFDTKNINSEESKMDDLEDMDAEEGF